MELKNRKMTLCTRCRTVVWVKSKQRSLKKTLKFFSPDVVNVVKMLVASVLCSLWVPVRRLGDLFQRSAEKMIENVNVSLENNQSDKENQTRYKKVAFKQLINLYINVWQKFRSIIDPMQQKIADKANSKASLNPPQVSLKSWKSFDSLNTLKDEASPSESAQDWDNDSCYEDDDSASVTELDENGKEIPRRKFSAIPEHIKNTFFTSAKLYFPGYFWVFAFFSSLFCFTRPALTIIVLTVLTLTLILTERSKTQKSFLFGVEVSLALQLNLLFSCANAVLFEAGLTGALFLAMRYATIPIVVHLTYNSFTTKLFPK